jgi:ATP-dependent Clp protease ATP-binding subunit ClpA
MPDPAPAGYASWLVLIRFLAHFFSLKLLARTLLAGWKRDTAPGFEWWQRLVLKGIFIVAGFVIRLIVIAAGLVAIALSVVTLPVFLLAPVRLSYERLARLGSIGRTWAYGYSYTLHTYGIRLHLRAEAKLYSRDETLAMVTRILSRDEKDNVLLVGEPGAGKETILAQFAREVYRGAVPPKLENREVIEIPLADMPPDRLRAMFAEAREAGNIIAVLREPEKYAGMLDEVMPMLRADELQVIAVTTLDGFVAGWKEREDVLRFFERVTVPPLSSEAALDYLGDYAAAHYPAVRFDDGVFEEIVRRTDELIQTKAQPEKSADLLQELVVGRAAVTIADVDAILAQKTGVPIGALSRDEKQVLLTLEDRLKAEIIDQDQAVHDVVSALRRARTGIASKGKPIGSFLFLGPTGTGKTHTAEILAREYFAGEGVVVRFDMSEFALAESEPAFVARLTLAIEEHPYCLLFLDELEKAERAIWNTLLQVLDEGRLTAANGRAVSFTNAIVIATSNAGTAYVEAHPGIGKRELMERLVLEQIFTPEFLNRFDDIVLFHALTREDAAVIVRLMLRDLNARLAEERGVTVDVTDSLIARLVALGFDEQNGARALRRAIQDTVENAVADAVLRDEAPQGSVLSIPDRA